MADPRSDKSLVSLGAYFTAKRAIEHGFNYSKLNRAKQKGLLNPLHGLYIDPRIKTEYRTENLYARLDPDSKLNRTRYAHFLLAKAYLEKYPDNVWFSHQTAALIWDLPVTLPGLTPLFVSRSDPAKYSKMSGVKTRIVSTAQPPVTLHRGLQVTTAEATWIDLAPTLSDADVVALADAILFTKRMPRTGELVGDPLATKADLAAAIGQAQVKDRPRLERLLTRAVSKSASPPETHLRLKLEDWGFAPEALDYDVYSRNREFLGCSEITYPSRRVVFEYEGDYHRTEEIQWQRDLQKYSRYHAAGWTVIRVTRDLLYRDSESLRRIAMQALL